MARASGPLFERLHPHAPCRWSHLQGRTQNPDPGALKRLSQTPARDHRRNRVYTDFQGPSSGGRSRQGVAPRASHRTASTTNRSPLCLNQWRINGSLRARPTSVSRFARNKMAETRPPRVSQGPSAQDRLAVFDLESKTRVLGNPVNEDAA